jgi:hypothetical protein
MIAIGVGFTLVSPAGATMPPSRPGRGALAMTRITYRSAGLVPDLSAALAAPAKAVDAI